MNIALLADPIEVLPTLADWYRGEWEPNAGIDGPGDALADLGSRCNKTALPIGLFALEGDEVEGVAALSPGWENRRNGGNVTGWPKKDNNDTPGPT